LSPCSYSTLPLDEEAELIGDADYDDADAGIESDELDSVANVS